MSIADMVALVAPEFSSVDEDVVNSFVNIVKPLVSKEKFGDLYYQAIAYLTAHKLALAGYGSESGGFSIADMYGVNSYSLNGVSLSFGATPSNMLQKDAEYTSTKYGLEYLSLRRSVIVPITTNGGQ